MQLERPYRPAGDVDVYNTVVIPNRMRRISWGAILAGVFIALVTSFALYMLGLAVGAAAVNPAQDVDPTEGLGVGTVIWLVATNLIALFLGGYTAGRMAGMTDDGDGVLHGLVTWAVVTAISLVMLTSTIGSIASGVTSAFASIITTTGQAVGEVAPEVATALNIQDDTLASIQAEARSFIEVVSEEETTTGVQTQTDAPLTLEQLQLNRDIRAFFAQHPDDITESDRDELATSIAERTTLTEPEARERVDSWEAFYVSVREDAETLAREVAQTTTDVIALLAGAIFAMMIVGAFAAGAGGYVATEVVEDIQQDAITEETA